MAYWDVLINGVALNTQGTGVSGLSGFGGLAGRDYYSQTSYARDGQVSLPGGLAPGAFSITVWASANDRTTGIQPSNPEEAIGKALENWMWIVDQMVSDYTLTVAIVVPGKLALTAGQKTRVAECDLVSMSTPVWNEDRTAVSAIMALRIPDTYWRALGGGTLDSAGYATISGTGNMSVTLPRDVYPMNGFIEDAIVTVQNSTTILRSVSFKALNLGSGSVPPEMLFTTPRTTGLIPASGKLVVDCQKYTALMTSGSVVENVYKFADHKNQRPGSMLRISPPYTISATFTPTTSGQAVTGVTWSIKYRPSFI